MHALVLTATQGPLLLPNWRQTVPAPHLLRLASLKQHLLVANTHTSYEDLWIRLVEPIKDPSGREFVLESAALQGAWHGMAVSEHACAI